MARPPTGVTGHGLATYKGAASYGQGPLQRGGLLRPAGMVSCSTTLVGAASSQGAVPTASRQGVAASSDSDASHRDGGDDTVRMREEG
ncbi:hypothetical protein B296_00046774 [Ensete ventricosum]|uniref:Uncharacterized protein n=1 Tax=Ensete ventricosum TaxID=4639 RepID=A0A426Y0R7_ENSVE|nr:hypothetical protein B296_00046774 [Ensete ventricosum]